MEQGGASTKSVRAIYRGNKNQRASMSHVTDALWSNYRTFVCEGMIIRNGESQYRIPAVESFRVRGRTKKGRLSRRGKESSEGRTTGIDFSRNQSEKGKCPGDKRLETGGGGGSEEEVGGGEWGIRNSTGRRRSTHSFLISRPEEGYRGLGVRKTESETAFQATDQAFS